MGPTNACSYADLAMGEIDTQARFNGPNYWFRHRDNVIAIWTLGVSKLLEFTDYINSLYTTIRFEVVYSESGLNVLNLTLYLTMLTWRLSEVFLKSS